MGVVDAAAPAKCAETLRRVALECGLSGQNPVAEVKTEAGAEAVAKAALLNHLRLSGELAIGTTVISELVINGWARRIDLVLIGKSAVAVEIKTKNDNLGRLSEQVTAYREAFPEVYVAIATRHLRAARALIPNDVGIFELQGNAKAPKVKKLRRAIPRVRLVAKTELSLLPSRELRRLFSQCSIKTPGARLRTDLERFVDRTEQSVRSGYVRRFLRSKYQRTSESFWEAVTDRKISPFDLQHLRLWRSAVPNADTAPDDGDHFFSSLRSEAGELPLGPIPDDMAYALKRICA